MRRSLRLLALVLLAGAGCGRDPIAEAERETRIAEGLAQVDRHDSALVHAARALRWREQAFAAGSPQTAGALATLGAIHLRLGHLETADSLLRRSLAALGTGAAGPAVSLLDPSFVTTRLIAVEWLAQCAEQLGNVAEAESLYRQVVGITEHSFGPDDPIVGRALHDRGRLLARLGRHDEADGSLQRAVEIHERALGPGSPLLAPVLTELAALRRAQGRDAEAAALDRRARSLEERPRTPPIARRPP